MATDEARGGDTRGPVVVLGATNLIASYLLPRLVAAGFDTVAVARRGAAVPPGVRFERAEIEGEGGWTAQAGARLVSVLPLDVLAAALPRLGRAHSLVAVGSTSLFSKAGSRDPADRATAEKLGRAEAAVMAWAAGQGVAATILRPTLVYDGHRDRNIARMIRLARRARVLPIARPSGGLRQPIHADDVAAAIMGAIDAPRAAGRAFDIAGGEVLTYRAMAERVFRSQGLTPRLLALPVPWLARAFALAARVGALHETGFGATIFERMNQDLVFDTREGLDVLGYRPRGFDPPRWDGAPGAG